MRAARKTAARKRSAPRYMFAKQTMLARNEMRINFLQSDRDALELITSMEALGETKLLAHVYVRLVLAQRAFGESEGVLRFAGTEQMTAWQQLVEYLRVADATARKALVWLEEQGAIGYWAGKNGAGIRIFLNRAVSSIRKRPEYLCAVGAEEKNLPESPASIEEPVRSRNEAAFRTQEAERDFKKEIETHAPANGAESISESEIATIGLSDQLATNANGRDPAPSSVPDSSKPEPQPRALDEELIVKRIERRLEPVLLKFTAAAAAREHDETRRWLNDYGIPKAVRVAHREGHVALKRLGVSDLAAVRARTELAVGAEVPQAQSTIDKTHDGTQKMNAAEAAEVCAMMFEVHGRAVDDLLGELVSTGCLPDPDEAAKARTTTLELLAGRESRCSGT